MKNLAIAFIAFFAFNINANAVNLPVINKIDNNTFVLDVTDWKAETIKVTITNKNDVVVFTESMINNVSLRKYNLDNLPVGEYTFFVEDQTKTVSQGIGVYHDHIEVSTNTSKTFKPLFDIKDDAVILNYLAKGADFEFTIVDHSNAVLYKKDINNKAVVNKSFDIAALTNGSYTAIVNVDNKMYTYDFVK